MNCIACHGKNPVEEIDRSITQGVVSLFEIAKELDRFIEGD